MQADGHGVREGGAHHRRPTPPTHCFIRESPSTEGLSHVPGIPAGAANDKYGLQMDFDSLPQLVERFGLAPPAEMGNLRLGGF